MPYWEKIKLKTNPSKFGFQYQQRYDLYYRGDLKLKCKKSMSDSGEKIHVWELDNRIVNCKIKLSDEKMYELFISNPKLRHLFKYENIIEIC
jgi:hypothetical protein